MKKFINSVVRNEEQESERDDGSESHHDLAAPLISDGDNSTIH